MNAPLRALLISILLFCTDADCQGETDNDYYRSLAQYDCVQNCPGAPKIKSDKKARQLVPVEPPLEPEGPPEEPPEEPIVPIGPPLEPEEPPEEPIEPIEPIGPRPPEPLPLLCRCDEECEVYGDCCPRANTTTAAENTPPLYGLQCRSSHLDPRTKPERLESFWMVSACPADWLAGRDDQLLLDTLNNCTSGSANLPPVTDVESGIVYKNEYCAVCHEVENFQLWGYRFECTNWLNVMLETDDFQLTMEIVEQECIACGFYAPQTSSRPRDCIHDSLVFSSCLERQELQDVTGVPIEEEQYQDIVSQCQSGPIRPLSIGSCPFRDPEGESDRGRNGRNVFHLRNQYCAICNGVNLTAEKISCSDPYTCLDTTNHCREEAAKLRPAEPTATPPTPPPPADNTTDGNSTVENENVTDQTPLIKITPFSVFLDVNGDSQVFQSSTVSVTITTSCSDGQVFDPISQMCRPTICPESAHGESCAIVQLIRGSNTTQNDSLACEGALISLENSEFQLLTDNKTLLFNDEVFDVLGYTENMPIICTNFSENGTHDVNVTVLTYSYPAAFSIVTYIGCSLSLFGCALVLLTYGLFKELRTLPGKILMNLSATILATCLFIVVGVPLFALAEKDELCQTTAIFLHWLVLCQFSWMAIMSYELARTVIRATRMKLVQDKDIQHHILSVYMLIGWGLPTVITILSVIVNYTTDYVRYGQEGFCWISHTASFYVVVIVPVALAIILNSVTFSVTAYILFRASRSEAKLQKQRSSYYYFRIYLSVFSITGLTWVFGFVGILSRDDWAWYLFIILTSTQGFTICIAFLFTQKVFTLYKQFFWPKISRTFSFKSSSKPSTSSSMLRNGDKVGSISSEGHPEKGLGIRTSKILKEEEEMRPTTDHSGEQQGDSFSQEGRHQESSEDQININNNH